MNLRLLPLLLLSFSAARADTFGNGANEFTIDFVEIGNAGNPDDDTGYGGVDYVYRISAYEVSESMIGSYNALSGGPVITLDNRGPNRPATGVTWNEAARFVNWLNTSQGYSAAYNFTTGGANDNLTLWMDGDEGFDPTNPFRNRNAYYFLPSDDEWYKAAYYDPSARGGSGGYWNFATGSDDAPSPVVGGTDDETAVFGQFSNGPAVITNAGGLSPYGTMAQGGNVWELIESAFVPPNDSGSEARVFRGGSWVSDAGNLASFGRGIRNPTAAISSVGFRVASVPEPSAFFLTLLGMAGLVLRRKRV